jgi:chemotaxis signal transduction protein
MSTPGAAPDAPEAAGELRGSARLDVLDTAPLAWLIPAGVAAHWQSRPAVWALPGAPGSLRGVTYWLGHLAPVFDVARWLAPDRAPAAVDHLILLALPRGPAALRVCGAPDLVHIDPAHAGAPADPVPGPLREFLRPRRCLDGGVVHEFAVESWLTHVRSRAAPAATGTQERT